MIDWMVGVVMEWKRGNQMLRLMHQTPPQKLGLLFVLLLAIALTAMGEGMAQISVSLQLFLLL
jgi:hypothetical protein